MTGEARVVATTERLVLRTEAEGDRAIYLAQMNTPENLHFLGGPQSEAKVAESFERMRVASAEGRPSFYVIALKDDPEMIGRCGLSTIDPAQAPDALRGQLQIGWGLRPDRQGQGYALEAARAALKMAFGQFNAVVVFGQTSQTNVPSWRLMEKLGMTRMAQLDYEDPDYPLEHNPTMVYRLLREEWQA
jgi:RimJ/RimL family protein N-acetyltransferase